MQEFEMTPEEIREKIKDMTWSFSRVNGFQNCSYSWYLAYVEEQESLPNAYAQFGTVCHETIEKYLKGELDMFDVSDYYQEHYPEIVTCDFPSNKYVDLGEKAFQQGKEYFDNINFDFDRYEVLAVEKEFKFMVGKYPFHGFVDALYRDKQTGEIILRDHKTSSFKYLKDNSISKSNMSHFLEFKRQLYLYAIPVIAEFGKVDWLTWNMIRDQRVIKIPFNKDEFEEAQKWCIDTIETIENETMWLPNTSESYRCSCICSNRNMCIYRQ